VCLLTAFVVGLPSGKRANSPQLFTGPPSEGIARKGRNPAANKYPPADYDPARPNMPSLVKTYCNWFIQKKLELKSFINRAIFLSLAASPLVFSLLMTFL
jgi:hypothetical protein